MGRLERFKATAETATSGATKRLSAGAQEEAKRARREAKAKVRRRARTSQASEMPSRKENQKQQKLARWTYASEASCCAVWARSRKR